MKKILCVIGLMAALIISTVAADATPRVKSVTLEKHTTLTVYVVPNLGTRFIFPFILDESDNYVPYTNTRTNKAFTYDREPGRNSFVISIAPQPSPQSEDIFVTAAGYLITIQVMTTNDVTQTYSDINFVMGDADREELIQQAIRRRTKVLEDDFKKKAEDLDKLAEQRAIAKVGVLALQEPSTTRIKEQSVMELPNGDNLILYVDEALTYSPYTIFSFELRTDSDNQNVSILDAKLFSIDPQTKTVMPVDVAKSIPKRVAPGDVAHGVITTIDDKLNPKKYLKLQILTDKGTLEAKW